MKTHLQTMTDFYQLQSGVYDATRWIFSHGRDRLIESLRIRPGERILEIGCGTGRNFGLIQHYLQGSGELTGVDCSRPMLNKASQRIRSNGWKNVLLIDHEYGCESITRCGTDVVLFSYSLSMTPNWELAFASARSELRPGGRIGMVDFSKPASNPHGFEAAQNINAEENVSSISQELFNRTLIWPPAVLSPAAQLI